MAEVLGEKITWMHMVLLKGNSAYNKDKYQYSNAKYISHVHFKSYWTECTK